MNLVNQPEAPAAVPVMLNARNVEKLQRMLEVIGEAWTVADVIEDWLGATVNGRSNVDFLAETVLGIEGLQQHPNKRGILERLEAIAAED